LPGLFWGCRDGEFRVPFCFMNRLFSFSRPALRSGMHFLMAACTVPLFSVSAQDGPERVTQSTLEPVVVESMEAGREEAKPKRAPFFAPRTVSPAPTVDPVVLNDRFVGTVGLEEEAEDGVYGEPEWVGRRRFSTTRVYIQKDPWEVGIEEWYRVRTYDGGRYGVGGFVRAFPCRHRQ